MSRYISVDVEISLSDIATKDLIAELNCRDTGNRFKGLVGRAAVRQAIAELEANHCPAALVEAIRQWDYQEPIVTHARLERWMQLATAGA